MNALSELQKEIMARLAELGIPREDILAVMLMLTKEEKARDFLSLLQEKETFSADQIREMTARIAFRDREESREV